MGVTVCPVGEKLLGSTIEWSLVLEITCNRNIIITVLKVMVLYDISGLLSFSCETCMKVTILLRFL